MNHPVSTTKPYLIRAIRDWALDNDLTPQILVDAHADEVKVPVQYVNNGQIVLNIAAKAVQMHVMDNRQLSFSARFDGAPFRVEVPVGAVLAIYARENGQGIFFKDPDSPPEPVDEGAENKKPPRPKLKLVK